MTPTAIRQARETIGMTQSELAEVIGVRRGYINRMENAHTKVSPAIAIAMKAMLLLGKPENWPDSIDTLIDADQVTT